MKLIVGIDFGTSTTVVRYKEEGTDVIKPIKDADGVSDIIPSAIFRVDGQNQTVVRLMLKQAVCRENLLLISRWDCWM
jgi:molecular chaperone DnaK (HSP70)